MKKLILLLPVFLIACGNEEAYKKWTKVYPHIDCSYATFESSKPMGAKCLQIVAIKQQKMQIKYELFLLENNKKNNISYDKTYLSNLKSSISDLSFAYSASTESDIINKLNIFYSERNAALENKTIISNELKTKIDKLESELASKDSSYKTRLNDLNKIKQISTYKNMSVYTEILNRFKNSKSSCSYNEFILKNAKC